MGAVVLALACHPDDIEFMMAGTLMLLGSSGCSLHYMNLADGGCGTAVMDIEEIVRVRRREAMNAAGFLGAAYHESLVPDLQVYYTDELIRRVTAIVREVRPEVLLLPSPEDYMEDHMAAARIGVTAAFCRGMRNFPSIPSREPTLQDVTLYHALPYGLTDGLRRAVTPDFFIDITSVIDRKERMLAFHESQKKWLDESQGLDSYLAAMREMSREVGRMSVRFTYAEGWRRRSHLGYSSREADPLSEMLRVHRLP